MTVGLRRGSVILHAHDPDWAQDFADEKQRLQAIFGDEAGAIEHVGSTAVPGLSAKPVIDIEVGLKDFSKWRQFVAPLESAGYTFMPDRVRADEVFMPKGPETARTHYLHVTQFDSKEWRGVLKFRDRLRADSKTRTEYETLKAILAQQFPGDRAAYAAGKKAFIERAIQ